MPKDDSTPCDGGADGWQLTDNQTAVVQCGPACEKLKQSANATVSVTVGCATVIR